MPIPKTIPEIEPALPRALVRVEFGTIEDSRRVVASALAEAGLSPSKVARISGRIVAGLRAGGLLGACVEQHYNATDAARLVSRHPEYVVKEMKAGRFGRVFRDGGGWLVPASGVQAWLDSRAFFPAVVSDFQQKEVA